MDGKFYFYYYFFVGMKHRTTKIAINFKSGHNAYLGGRGDLPQACLFSCLLTHMVDSYTDMVEDMRAAEDMVEDMRAVEDMVEDTVEMSLAAAVVA